MMLKLLQVVSKKWKRQLYQRFPCNISTKIDGFLLTNILLPTKLSDYNSIIIIAWEDKNIYNNMKLALQFFNAEITA